MKNKNIVKKIELNKETIANLEWAEMNKIKGGTAETGVSISCALCSSIVCATTLFSNEIKC